MTTAALSTEVARQLGPTTAKSLDGDQRSCDALVEMMSRGNRSDVPIHHIRLRTDIG